MTKGSGNRMSVECPQCGTVFQGLVSEYRKGRRCCSRACGALLRYYRSQSHQDLGLWARMQRSREIADSGCWLWTGTMHENGYGLVSAGIPVRAHRAAYVLTKGAIPEGFVIDHLCENKRCFNPDHLEAVTQSVNLRRARESAQRKKAAL